MALAPGDAKSIFLAAVEQTPAERPAFLDRACGDNVALRRRVEARRCGTVSGPCHVGGPKVSKAPAPAPLREIFGQLRWHGPETVPQRPQRRGRVVRPAPPAAAAPRGRAAASPEHEPRGRRRSPPEGLP
jgi:hypothetical protein